MLPKKYLIAFLIATLAGACLHFLYVFFPNLVTAVFGPVNESVWEHVKLIYWPYLAAAIFLTRGEPSGAWRGHLISLLSASALMLLIGYVVHVLLGMESTTFDLILYVLLMGLAFGFSGVYKGKGKKAGGVGVVLPLLAIVLGAAILIFTFFPPDCRLFADLSALKTWATIPY